MRWSFNAMAGERLPQAESESAGSAPDDGRSGHRARLRQRLLNGGAEALAEATLIVVPCLAVGPDGSRLGTGGGWYDRALPHRSPGAPVIAVARDAEVLDDLATLTLPHDVPVDGYVTERVSVHLPR